MTTGTMHMGGNAAGAARPGAGCSTLDLYVGTTLPSIAFPWHETIVSGKQVDPVFATDRPTRRPLERFP
jgi:hypothetical protein